MKKILITFFILILSYNKVIANECKIEEQTPSILLEYIKNNRLVIKNISDEIIENQKEATKIQNDYNEVKTKLLQIYNTTFNFDGYYSYFYYFAVFPIKNEIPYQVKRDYDLLSKESNGLKYYLENILKGGNYKIEIKDPCKGVKNCDLEKNSIASEILGKLIKNNEAIMNLYRNTIIGEVNKNNFNFILVNNNFELEIEKNYRIEEYSKCSGIEGGFFYRIYEEGIKIINKNISIGKEGTKKWQEAIDLLQGNDTKNQKYNELEKQLLKDELSKQGIYGDSQTNMMDALEKYNIEGGFSKNNNFIINTFNNTGIKLEKKLKEFKEEVIGDFFNKKPEVSTNNINRANENSKKTIKIKEEIDKLYLEMNSLEGMSELNTSNLRNKIINIHIDLSNSINTLELSCEKAVKICNEQDYGNGNCGKCN